MTKRDWIRQHRGEIDEFIRQNNGGDVRNDTERELWVLNNPYLYCMVCDALGREP